MTSTPLKQTPLHASHVELGARMIPFAGWDMPVQYAGILSEATAVRAASGLFDVSHMGRFIVEGPHARELLNWTHTSDISEAMPIGRARYGLFCNEDGGIIDDGIVYRLADDRFLAIANAANAATVYAWFEQWRSRRLPATHLRDITRDMAMLALQGPRALDTIEQLSDFDRSAVRPFRIAECTIEGRWAWVARTGYTGEDGVEIMPRSEDALYVWQLLLEQGVTPCGLGARDTLRLEAGLPLHGNDIGPDTNPLEARLARFVALEGGAFCGSEALQRIAEEGPPRRLVGMRTIERGALPRQHSPIMAEGERVGEVTSGGYSPALDTNIALGYVPARLAALGLRLHIEVRGKSIEAETVALPFYTRSA